MKNRGRGAPLAPATTWGVSVEIPETAPLLSVRSVSPWQIHSFQAFGASLPFFSTPHSLFSATCSLFLQNTPGGGGQRETRTSFCNFGDEDGVRLHRQRIGHAGERFVEAGHQDAELGRCKSEGGEIEASLLVGCGHVQDDEDRFVFVATQVSKRMGIIFVDGNVAAVEQRRLFVPQSEQLAVKAEDGIFVL